MKKLLICLAVAVFSNAITNEAYAIKLHFQTRAHGKDCDKDRGLCIYIEVDVKEILVLTGLPKALQTEAVCNGQTLTLTTTAIGTPWEGNDFIVDGNIKLSDEVSNALGYNSVTILSGKYNIDFTRNKLGNISLQVKTE